MLGDKTSSTTMRMPSLLLLLDCVHGIILFEKRRPCFVSMFGREHDFRNIDVTMIPNSCFGSGFAVCKGFLVVSLLVRCRGKNLATTRSLVCHWRASALGLEMV